ncbi:hypothetical protein AVEN_70237-1 [Araneus ventricosus]|uniref:Uncharacterized protein n=1 Tax=Araneus ventricosus TaxID=182803 RepID=A0A4Y2GA97_ARAVE|nr:hypothetical protein AVEN_70237-1 [Araneus ventricosus]
MAEYLGESPTPTKQIEKLDWHSLKCNPNLATLSQLQKAKQNLSQARGQTDVPDGARAKQPHPAKTHRRHLMTPAGAEKRQPARSHNSPLGNRKWSHPLPA